MKLGKELLFLIPVYASAVGQSPWNPNMVIDPARSVTVPVMESTVHHAVPEAYIWTAQDSLQGNSIAYTPEAQSEDLAPHYFRRIFNLDEVPAAATLYIAGPRTIRAYVNGELMVHVEFNLDSQLGMHVYAKDVTRSLRKGSNVIAIEAIRGPGAGEFANSRLTMQVLLGKVLAVKLVPAARGIDQPPLVISDQKWRGSLMQSPNWASPSFDDGSWKQVESLGGLESSIDLLQWNADAGLYDWPGYDGISPFLAHHFLPPVLVSHAYSGSGALQNLNALTAELPDSGEFSVQLPAEQVEEPYAPQILLDFGREVNGRLQFISDSDGPSKVTVQYGESEAETLNDPYLGINPLYISPHATGYGPKSAFRYALVRFVGGSEKFRFKSIRLDSIYYPVEYQGSFESSDNQLNLLWAIGAYTAHLCMQDDIWDAPKRDRERWMGDLDVSGRTINDVFADHFLIEDTLDHLIGPAPIHQHVNGIAGYSAFWITGEAEYYLHSGSRQQLESVHGRLVQLMHYMEAELDQRNLFANQTHSWLFVDWSPELNGDTPEARRVTQFEYYAAFQKGVYLLNELGDTSDAQIFERKADELKEAAQRYLLDPSSSSFGTRWQTNAYAVFSGVADPSQYAAIWRTALSSVGHVKNNALIITPYYNYYVVSAMAKMGHRQEALNWIREYWGGMVNEGATSFWEGYDPSWYKGDDFHASLQADNVSGYSVSLAHGWSSGVTPWLMEQVLGINVTGPSFSTVDIRPDLIDLQWVKGGEPTPRGIIAVAVRKGTDYITTINLPAGTVASVSVPVISRDAQVMVNGKVESSTPAENGARAIVVLHSAGHYDIESR